MSVFSNWTVARRLIVSFGLAALTLVVIAAVSYRNTYRLIDNDAWVTHTYQVQTELADLVSPPVSVLSYDPVLIGRTAGELLIRRLTGEQAPPRLIEVPVRLIERG